MNLLSATRPNAKQKAIEAVTKGSNTIKTSFRIPVELHQALKLKCVKEGISMGDVLIKAIRQYVNKDVEK